MNSHERTVLVGGVLADGTRADIAIDATTGIISGVGDIEHRPGDEAVDCTGMVVLASAVDAHAHLDKVLSARDRAAMPATLNEAVQDWMERWPNITTADFVERATEAVELMAARGTTAIRTHVDVGTGVGLRSVEALVQVRDDVAARGIADLQVVALAAPPLGGAAGAPHRRLLESAVDAGIDIIGGSPDIDPDLPGATIAAFDVAERARLPLDLHCDQSTDPHLFGLRDIIRLTNERDVVAVVASHCVSLASQPESVQHETAELMAAAGIGVTTMPLTSLFYFGWDQPVGPPRGLTAIRVLKEHGVVVAAGADNVRDVFFPLGRFDPFETASVLAMAAHCSPAEAWAMCTVDARRVMGLPPVSVEVGSRADLVAIRGQNLNEAVAAASEHRTVLRAGRVIARTLVNGGIENGVVE